jgi:hypothetical protein
MNPPVTAPPTQSYVTPTFVPTSTPTCQPSAIPVYGWRKSFVEANVKSFCDELEGSAFAVSPQNPLWHEQTFAAKLDSDPSYHDLSLYIHYEQHACPPIDVEWSYQPTSQQCQDRFAWLWTDPAGCGNFERASESNSSDTGPWVPPAGYYADCMWWQLRDSGTSEGYGTVVPAPLEATMTPVPDLTSPGTYEAASNGRCESYDTVHWERRTASSAASKFCSQMSATGHTYMASSTGATMAPAIWTGQPTERSYPVPTNAGYPALRDPKSIKFRITHDESACNSTQREGDSGCRFTFHNAERCLHWLLTAIDSCEQSNVYDYYDAHFIRPLGLDWVPRVQVSGDGIKWEIDQGVQCKNPWLPPAAGIDSQCYNKDWIEQ